MRSVFKFQERNGVYIYFDVLLMCVLFTTGGIDYVVMGLYHRRKDIFWLEAGRRGLKGCPFSRAAGLMYTADCSRNTQPVGTTLSAAD